MEKVLKADIRPSTELELRKEGDGSRAASPGTIA